MSGEVLALPVSEYHTEKALWLDGDIWLMFSEPVRNVALCFGGSVHSVEAYANGNLLERVDAPSGRVELTAVAIDGVLLKWPYPEGGRLTDLSPYIAMSFRTPASLPIKRCDPVMECSWTKTFRET
ncbi:MAG: hypothetical protein DMG11_34095 [Acidobacteria bacterium]|nr:MAG: hypothetical protein DMG11_34095 [Acidobacteriota bacterium]